MTKLPSTLTRALALGLLFAPSLAQAHPGHSSGLTDGLAHPFFGLDHLAAMLGVGLWASQLGGRARFLVPLAFIGSMLLGACLGISGLAVTGVEQGIAASLFVIGLFLVFQFRLPAMAAVLLMGVFAMFHGFAHGSELPSASNPAAYCIGFLASTAVLHLCGLGLGTLSSQLRQPAWVRAAGMAVVTCGVISLSLRL